MENNKTAVLYFQCPYCASESTVLLHSPWEWQKGCIHAVGRTVGNDPVLPKNINMYWERTLGTVTGVYRVENVEDSEI